MHERHRHDSISTLLKHLVHRIVADASSLKREKAANDLQIIFHPVVDFLKENLFFGERSLELFLSPFSFNRIKDGSSEQISTPLPLDEIILCTSAHRSNRR